MRAGWVVTSPRASGSARETHGVGVGAVVTGGAVAAPPHPAAATQRRRVPERGWPPLTRT